MGCRMPETSLAVARDTDRTAAHETEHETDYDATLAMFDRLVKHVEGDLAAAARHLQRACADDDLCASDRHAAYALMDGHHG